MDKFKIAISSTGIIARKMAATVAGMAEVEVCAVASRTQEAAQAFAQEFGIPKAYGSYEQLAADDEPQLIYVASPHSHHFEHAALYLNAGRPVLVEKAFTANARQARELFALAAEKKVFVCEAMWTRFTPLMQTIARLVLQGAIGRPLLVQASAGGYLSGVPRITSPALAGGALLDVGVYPITLASMVLGAEVERCTAVASMLDTGVDALNNIVLQYTGGQMAALTSSVVNTFDPRWHISGETGRIEVHGISNPQLARLLDKEGREVTAYECPPQITGYEYEVAACAAALWEGRTECEEMPHAETLRVMELMDTIRAQWGMRYPFEPPEGV